METSLAFRSPPTEAPEERILAFPIDCDPRTGSGKTYHVLNTEPVVLSPGCGSVLRFYAFRPDTLGIESGKDASGKVLEKVPVLDDLAPPAREIFFETDLRVRRVEFSLDLPERVKEESKITKITAVLKLLPSPSSATSPAAAEGSRIGFQRVFYFYKDGESEELSSDDGTTAPPPNKPGEAVHVAVRESKKKTSPSASSSASPPAPPQTSSNAPTDDDDDGAPSTPSCGKPEVGAGAPAAPVPIKKGEANLRDLGIVLATILGIVGLIWWAGRNA